MTATIGYVGYRLMSYRAAVTPAGDVTVTEHWVGVTITPEGRTERPLAEPVIVARSPRPLTVVDAEDAEDMLFGAGYVPVRDWTINPDGSLAVEVDHYDPTP